MRKHSVELTEAEWTIIKAVWNGEPCAAPDIQERLETSTHWTYSTVRTLMDRMVSKGILKAEKIRNLTLFHSAITREQAQQGELLHTLKNAFNGAMTPMLQCMINSDAISEKELAELEALIKAKRTKR